jgi:hypothetical protein
MYNLVNGFNPACVWIMPMLGRKQEEYPRFRDCFVENGNIAIYTRVGGNNRNCGFGEEKLYSDPDFIKTYDDGFDETYATYLFRVPEKWKADFDKIMDGKMTEVSIEYQNYLREFFPILNEKGLFDKVFKKR